MEFNSCSYIQQAPKRRQNDRVELAEKNYRGSTVKNL